jgi:hypothetical protein
MATMYCALCRRAVDARRHIGGGSVLLALGTMGFSILAIPFYAKRCPICKSTAVSHTPTDLAVPSAGATQPGGTALARVSALEQRLGAAEGELEATVAELERVRTERDFYRELLGDRAPPSWDRPG